jgi:hypothetical protein
MMYCKKYMPSLSSWGVFREEKDKEDMAVVTDITESDADRLLRELGIGRKVITTTLLELDTRMVIQIIGMPRYDWDKIRAAFEGCKEVNLICVGTEWKTQDLPF